MTDQKEKIRELAAERSRGGKKPRTNAEVLEQLYRIRDGASAWLEQCVIYAKKDGIREAQQLFDHACKRIAILERKK